MGNHTEAPTSLITEYKLDLHFGGKQFPTQQGALLFVTATILLQEPQTAKSLVAAFQNTKYVPHAVTIEPEEAKWLLQHGEQNDWFTFDRKTALNNLTTEFRAMLLQSMNARKELLAAIKKAFTDSLGDEPYVTTVHRFYYWERLLEYVPRRVLQFIQNASQQVPEPNNAHVLQEILEKTPHEHIDPDVALTVALTYFPTFLQDTPHGQALFELTFNDTMYAFRTSISRSGSNRMAEEISTYNLILDTNMIITLLGLRQNDELTTGVRRVITTLIEFGVTVSYTSESEEELRVALRHAVQTVERHNAVLSTQGSDGRFYIKRQSIEAAYYAQRNLYPQEEFVARYSNVLSRLREDVSEKIEYIHIPQTDQDEICASRDYEVFYDLIRRPETSKDKIHHDALHLAYVLRQRRRNRRQSFWFITQHNFLTTLKLDPSHLAPATRLDWLFMQVRQFLPRVDNFPEFLHGFVSSNLFPPVSWSNDEFELRRQYIENTSERHPAELTRTMFLNAPSHIIRQVTEEFGLDRADEAFLAVKAHQDEMDATSAEARASDEETTAADEAVAEAERQAAWLRRRDEHFAQYQRALDKREDIKLAKQQIEHRRVTFKSITSIIAAAIGLLGAVTRVLSGLPVWAEFIILATPLILTGIVIHLYSMKSHRERSQLRGKLELLTEQLSELKANAP